MRILITSSRAPVALELIRAFGRAGHHVYATDTMRWTLGSHSRFLKQHLITPPPRQAPEAFGRALLEIVRHEQIDWLIPTSEEVFYVAAHYAALAAHTHVFTEPLVKLNTLHHKYRFQQQCAALGITTPRTRLLEHRAELLDALGAFPAFVLKPAYSRFATQVIANRGARALNTSIENCQPTPENPWLIQEYVDGAAVCTYTTLHQGRVTAHCAYRTPFQVDHGSGVQFESVDGIPTLKIIERIGAALGYTGQLSLDFIESNGTLFVLECNPRATSGLHLLDPHALVGGLTNPLQHVTLAPTRRQRQLALGMLAAAGLDLRRWPALIRALTTVGDVTFAADDPLPALTQIGAALHFAQVSRRKHISLVAAMTDDIEWNGESLGAWLRLNDAFL